jgi:hypothetical protein
MMIEKLLKRFLLLLAMVSLSACVSGGKYVNSIEPQSIVVSYRAKGPAPANVKWYLIRGENGLAMLERDLSNESKIVIEQGWKDRMGYHFVLWAEILDVQSTAFEFVVPDDITQPALRYAYPAGSYSIVKGNGFSRPVPHGNVFVPATRLVPEPK